MGEREELVYLKMLKKSVSSALKIVINVMYCSKAAKTVYIWVILLLELGP